MYEFSTLDWIGLDRGFPDPQVLDHSTVYRYPYPRQRQCFSIEFWEHVGLRHFQERSAFYGIYECIAIPTKNSCLPRMRIVTDIAAYFGAFILFWAEICI